MPVWQQSFELLIRIYKISKNYPSNERFGLISDMRRSANSIAHPDTSVGTEGFGRFEPKDKTRFYKISRGSVYELISQLLVSVALSYINEKTKSILVESACPTLSFRRARNIIEELNALIHSLTQRDSRGGVLSLAYALAFFRQIG